MYLDFLWYEFTQFCPDTTKWHFDFIVCFIELVVLFIPVSSFVFLFLSVGFESFHLRFQFVEFLRLLFDVRVCGEEFVSSSS